MSASQNNFRLLIQQLDVNGSPLLNRTAPDFQYAGAVGEMIEGILLNTNATPQTLPTANVLQFYFKNLHASAVITVTMTVQGGASQVVKKVQPGGFIAFHDPVTSATAGITALLLQSDTINATYEMFLGG